MTWRELKNQLSHLSQQELDNQATLLLTGCGYCNVADRLKKAKTDLYSCESSEEEGEPLFTKTTGIRERQFRAEDFDMMNREEIGLSLRISKGDWVLEAD